MLQEGPPHLSRADDLDQHVTHAVASQRERLVRPLAGCCCGLWLGDCGCHPSFLVRVRQLLLLLLAPPLPLLLLQHLTASCPPPCPLLLLLLLLLLLQEARGAVRLELLVNLPVVVVLRVASVPHEGQPLAGHCGSHPLHLRAVAGPVRMVLQLRGEDLDAAPVCRPPPPQLQCHISGGIPQLQREVPHSQPGAADKGLQHPGRHCVPACVASLLGCCLQLGPHSFHQPVLHCHHAGTVILQLLLAHSEGDLQVVLLPGGRLREQRVMVPA